METGKSQETLLDGRAGVVDSATQSPGQPKDPESQSGMKNRLMNRFLRWLYPNQRKASRHPELPLVGYVGTIRTSQAFPAGDISSDGFYMLTAEHWLPGTVIPVTLQINDTHGTGLAGTLIVQAKVVRSGPDGVGFAFVMAERGNLESGDSQLEGWGDKDALERFLQRLKMALCEEPQPPETT
jgi:hypothetical protein